MSSDRAPPERPDTPSEPDSDTSSDTDRGLSSILTRPGPRRTADVENLIDEAKIVADGHEPDNPWQPIEGSGAADEFFKRTADTDLEPAWMRPWEDGGDE